MTGMHECDICHSQWPSELAASYCCDPDEGRGRE